MFHFSKAIKQVKMINDFSNKKAKKCAKKKESDTFNSLCGMQNSGNAIESKKTIVGDLSHGLTSSQYAPN